MRTAIDQRPSLRVRRSYEATKLHRTGDAQAARQWRCIDAPLYGTHRSSDERRIDVIFKVVAPLRVEWYGFTRLAGQLERMGSRRDDHLPRANRLRNAIGLQVQSRCPNHRSSGEPHARVDAARPGVARQRPCIASAPQANRCAWSQERTDHGVRAAPVPARAAQRRQGKGPPGARHASFAAGGPSHAPRAALDRGTGSPRGAPGFRNAEPPTCAPKPDPPEQEAASIIGCRSMRRRTK